MYQKYVKRMLDLTMAFIAVVLLSPIMIIIAIAIRIESKGPIIFRQVRSGKDGKQFILYKFRSMVPHNDVHDKSTPDTKTKVGNFIRATSLDELPQLFNIIDGDMSFIGPRPWIEDYKVFFTRNQSQRLKALPGITGLAQCSGRNDISIKEKINLDVKYVNNVSFLMDISVFFKTIKCVIIGNGNDSNKSTISNEINDLKLQWR